MESKPPMIMKYPGAARRRRGGLRHRGRAHHRRSGAQYGLAVVGLADPARLMTIDRAAPGDQLILTKPVGTGVIATALKRGAPPPEVVKAAVASMIALNAGASQAALAAAVKAATDVTGFGLLGHLHRMLAASSAAATVTTAAVP